MIKMDLNDNTWHKVKSSPNVLGFVGGTSDKPVPLENSEAENLITKLKISINFSVYSITYYLY